MILPLFNSDQPVLIQIHGLVGQPIDLPILHSHQLLLNSIPQGNLIGGSEYFFDLGRRRALLGGQLVELELGHALVGVLLALGGEHPLVELLVLEDDVLAHHEGF
jgi:hypothetical protein